MKTALFAMALMAFPAMGCASSLKHSNVECDEYVYEYVHVPVKNKVKIVYVDSYGSYHEWRKIRRVHKIRRMKHKRKGFKKKRVVKYYH